MWETTAGNRVVRVAWFYHPEETTGCPSLKYPVRQRDLILINAKTYLFIFLLLFLGCSLRIAARG